MRNTLTACKLKIFENFESLEKRQPMSDNTLAVLTERLVRNVLLKVFYQRSQPPSKQRMRLALLFMDPQILFDQHLVTS